MPARPRMLATSLLVLCLALPAQAELQPVGTEYWFAWPETGDATDLAACLRRLADDLPLRQRLAAAGLHRARDFDPERTAAAVLACYDEVLGR